jgi:hypothetical protein
VSGNLDVLNVGHGHLKLTITEGDAAEIAKARRIIEDMMARGFAIFVETPKGLTRVKRFNSRRMTYVIDDTMDTTPAAEAPPRVKKTARRSREVRATKTKATAIGRSAGG